MVNGSQITGETPWSAACWESFLAGRFEFPIRVIYGRSRSAPVQARALRATATARRRARTTEPSGQGWELRLHHRFKDAPAEVRDALATWLRAGKRATKAGPILDAWIQTEIASLPAPERKVALDDQGLTHPLGEIALGLFETEFKGEFDGPDSPRRPKISWGRRTPSRSRRSLRLGSFEPTSRIVRVHPVLDQRGVPEWFVRFVLKHEILHAVIETYRDRTGRWVHHGPKFRQREASWPEFEAALLWERKNLARLIRSAREGSPLRVRAEDLIDPAPPPEKDALPEQSAPAEQSPPMQRPPMQRRAPHAETDPEPQWTPKGQIELPFG